jgi:uncharacterized membrane protein YdfJ with MMPL/SSD domain
MTCIALAQRATIIALSKEAVEVANGIMEGDLKGLEAIESLQKKYVQAQSQIMLFEVTAQEQGVELFNLLKEQMYINGNKKDLDNQMNNLRDIANIRSNHLERKSDIKLNNILAILSVFGLTLAVLQVAPLFLECYGIVGKVVSCVVAAIVLCLTMFIMIKLGLFNKEKSSGRKNENSASQKEPFYK